MRIGITIGDPNGIGPEVIAKALADPRLLTDMTPIIFGSHKVFIQVKKTCGLNDFNYHTIKNISEVQPKKINLLVCPNDEFDFQEGKSTKESAALALWSLDASTQALQNKEIVAVVTGPISKEDMLSNGFEFIGHTEYYEKLFSKGSALMVLCSGSLKVALATNHIPVKDISATITKDLLVAKLQALNKGLIEDFGVFRPKIAVLGLNPHAGENGKIGEEEMEVISPAISAANKLNVLAFGPYSSDGFFGSGAYVEFDAVLAMFHDQGLTGFKALSFDEGVNCTLGLDVIRTSPGHGTAFPIVGENKANETALRNALYMALDNSRNRRDQAAATLNKLAVSTGPKDNEFTS